MNMRPSRQVVPFVVAALVLAFGAQAATAECVRARVMASGVPVHFLYKQKDGRSPEEMAQAAWEHLVAWQFGKEYASWKNARRRRIDCWLPNRSKTQCKAEAIPCDGKGD